MSDVTNSPTEQTPETVDVLSPWGPEGPAPSHQWRRDILGKNFESRTLPLEPDDEGECVATLVRYAPSWDPQVSESPLPWRFVALFVHGRNDYFFQTELAESITRAGGAFYAIDLRKYGRSLRPWQTIGYVDDMATYDEDIAEALEVIRSDVGSLPLVLIGHSTGGLLVTLWANRHPGAVAGLVLNSAWLEMHTMASMRPAAQQILQRVAASNPMWEVPSGEGPDHYSRSLRGGWAESGLELPQRLHTFDPADPAIAGWRYATEWKRPGSYPVYAGWLEAIMEGHSVIDRSARIECPVLSMMSSATYSGQEWTGEVFSSDVVLDVTVNAERSARLSDMVTLARFPGRHDLFLSDPDVRLRVWDTMERWLRAFI